MCNLMPTLKLGARLSVWNNLEKRLEEIATLFSTVSEELENPGPRSFGKLISTPFCGR